MVSSASSKVKGVSLNDKVKVVKQFKRTSRGAIPLPDKITADFNSRSTFMSVPVDMLLVDPNYQRPLDKPRITTMAHNWNQSLVGAFVVNKRANGCFYVIDGQQRHGALQLIDNAPEYVTAEVFEGLTPKQEADMFYLLDTTAVNLTSGQGFKSLLAAGNPVALDIAYAAETAGLTVDPSRGPAAGNLRAYKTIIGMYKRIGREKLTRIFRIIEQSWYGNKNMGSNPMLLGLETFLNIYGDYVDEKHLVSVLKASDPVMIYAQASAMSTTLSSQVSKSTSQVIWSLYNKNLRKNRLEA